MGKAKNTKQLSLLPQASEGESELEAGMEPCVKPPACAGLLLPSSGELSVLTGAAVAMLSVSMWKRRRLVIHSGGAALSAFLKGTETREGLYEATIITTLQLQAVELPERNFAKNTAPLFFSFLRSGKLARSYHSLSVTSLWGRAEWQAWSY